MRTGANTSVAITWSVWSIGGGANRVGSDPPLIPGVPLTPLLDLTVVMKLFEGILNGTVTETFSSFMAKTTAILLTSNLRCEPHRWSDALKKEGDEKCVDSPALPPCCLRWR